MYIETSSPRQYGDIARLDFFVSRSDIGKLSCLKFHYHMYGDSINALNVYNGKTKMFARSGKQGDEWLKAEITMTLQSKVSCIYAPSLIILSLINIYQHEVTRIRDLLEFSVMFRIA